jgi:hypothetical protein
MSKRRRRVLGLCLPPVLLCLVDCVVTLAGQPPAYWSGNFASANELSPTFAQLLHTHPLAFVAGTAVILSVYVALIVLLPEVIATILSVALTLGHTFAASTWLGAYSDNFPYQLVNGFFVLSATVLGLSLHWAYQPGDDSRSDTRRGGSHQALRWGLAVLLVAVVSYLYLIPHR